MSAARRLIDVLSALTAVSCAATAAAAAAADARNSVQRLAAHSVTGSPVTAQLSPGEASTDHLPGHDSRTLLMTMGVRKWAAAAPRRFGFASSRFAEARVDARHKAPATSAPAAISRIQRSTVFAQAHRNTPARQTLRHETAFVEAARPGISKTRPQRDSSQRVVRTGINAR